MELKVLIPTLRPGDQRAMATHVAWVARSVLRPDLEPLADPDLDAMEEVFSTLSFGTGDLILGPDDPPGRAFIVRAGSVDLSVEEHGRRAVVGHVESGGSFGDIPMLCGIAPPFFATAARDATVLFLDQDRLPDLMRRHPEVAVRWITNVVRRLEYANRRIVGLTVGDLRNRMISVLTEEAANGHAERISITQTELAALLGATRQSVNRVIGRLAREGVVRQRYGVVEIVDEQLLARLAANGSGE